jgi:hypothetical protein
MKRKDNPPVDLSDSRATGRPIGRPSLFTPEAQAKIIMAVQAGNFLDTAARYAGVTYDTFRNWMVRGEKELARLAHPSAKPRESEAPFVDFFKAVTEAEAQAEVAAVSHWQTAIQGNWQAAAAFVKSRHRRRWDPPQSQVNVQLNLTADELAKLTDEDIAELSEGRIPSDLLTRLGRPLA